MGFMGDSLWSLDGGQKWHVVSYKPLFKGHSYMASFISAICKDALLHVDVPLFILNPRMTMHEVELPRQTYGHECKER